MKPVLKRINEPDANMVHYAPAPLQDAVSLCGLTDFITAKERGGPTTKPVTCNLCKALVKFIHEHKEP